MSGLPHGVAWHVPRAAGGHGLALWPQRVAHDPALGLLLVADAHFGKAASFRRLGVPVPEAVTVEALQRLDAVLQATGARELVFLGDLVHAAVQPGGPVAAAVSAWRARHAALSVTLVLGNHDARAGGLPPDWQVQVVSGPLRRGPWALVHEPQAVAGAYALAGHIHPGLVVSGRARQRLRLPCFRFGPGMGLLPAFGPFTGLHVAPLAADEQGYPVADGQVLAWPAVAGAGRRPV